MSFADKISSIMARPGQDPAPADDVPWYLKYGGRALGTVGGFIAIFLGVWTCLGLLTGNLTCLLGGIWQILAGFVAVCVEAPCCCLFIDYVQNLSDYVDKKPYWNRAVGYAGLAIPAVILCPGLSTIFGSGLIFTTGVIYGMMALGKKASLDDMRQAAVAVERPPNQAPPKSSSLHSNLVTNEHPISFTGAPVFDSNV